MIDPHIHNRIMHLECRVDLIRKWIDAHDAERNQVSRSVEYADQPPSAALDHAIVERDKALARVEELERKYDEEHAHAVGLFDSLEAARAAEAVVRNEQDKALADLAASRTKVAKHPTNKVPERNNMPLGKHIKIEKSTSEKGCFDLKFSGNNWQWMVVTMSKQEMQSLAAILNSYWPLEKSNPAGQSAREAGSTAPALLGADVQPERKP